MKNILTIILFTLVLSVNLQAATLIVNNLNPIQGQYATIQAAIDAAASGDVILIHGTPTRYGNVLLPPNKPITLRGTGWNTFNKFNKYPTKVGNIELDSSAHDIVIEGLYFDGGGIGIRNYQVVQNQYNITVQYCNLQAISLLSKCSNFTIRNNVIADIIELEYPSSYVSNTLIRHNIITGSFQYFKNHLGVIIDHNIFNGQYSFIACKDLNVTNNIFYEITNFAVSSSSTQITNCQFVNNLTYSSSGPVQLPTANDPRFIGNTWTNTGADLSNTDPQFEKTNGEFIYRNYRLKANSVGKNAGTDGKDVGVYTSDFTFSMTGEPETPSVRSLIINNPVVQSGNNLNFKITASKARADGN